LVTFTVFARRVVLKHYSQASAAGVLLLYTLYIWLGPKPNAVLGGAQQQLLVQAAVVAHAASTRDASLAAPPLLLHRPTKLAPRELIMPRAGE
jgi:hypothetical protein